MWAIASKQPRWLLKNHFPLYQASLTVLLGWMSSLRSPLSPCPCILETDILATSLSPPTHHTPTSHQPRSRLVRPDATSPHFQDGTLNAVSLPSRRKYQSFYWCVIFRARHTLEGCFSRSFPRQVFRDNYYSHVSDFWSLY